MLCVVWDRTAVESPMLDRRENRLLAALDPADYALVRPHLSTAWFERGAILQEQEAPVSHVYFPMSGLVSYASWRMDTKSRPPPSVETGRWVPWSAWAAGMRSPARPSRYL